MSNLAISALAWAQEEDEAALSILETAGIRSVEIVPGRISDAVGRPTLACAEAYAGRLAQHGLIPTSMQALLYGREDLQVFGDGESQDNLVSYVRDLFAIGATIGVRSYVFGSPRNKIINDEIDADAIATELFRRLGDEARVYNATLCIEPTPQMYGGNYLHTTDDAIRLLDRAAHSNLRLNVDFGNMLINNEDIDETLRRARPYIHHVQISREGLRPLIPDPGFFSRIGHELAKIEYHGSVVLEMVRRSEDTLDYLPPILDAAKAIYD